MFTSNHSYQNHFCDRSYMYIFGRDMLPNPQEYSSHLPDVIKIRVIHYDPRTWCSCILFLIASMSPRRYTSLLHSKDWRLWPLRLSFLLFFASPCLAFIVAIRILCLCSPDSCPPIQSEVLASFLFGYLLTILSVLFGLVPAVAHHDFLRMEPWFQPSGSAGAAPEDSLLLSYPYTFLLLVPVQGWRRGALPPLL